MHDEPWMDGLSDDWVSQPRASVSPLPYLSKSPNDDHHNFLVPYPHQNKAPASNSYPHDYTFPPDRSDSESNSCARINNFVSKPDVFSSDDCSLHRHSALTSPVTSQHSILTQEQTMHISRKRDSATDTPDWRKRIVRGELPVGENGDLFAPLGLERVFKPPTNSGSALQMHLSNSKPSSKPSFIDSIEDIHTNSGQGNDSLRDISLHGNDTAWMEHMSEAFPVGAAGSIHNTTHEAYTQNIKPRKRNLSSLKIAQITGFDARMRTASGLEELRNEDISPISLPKRNTASEESSQCFFGAEHSNWQERRPTSPVSDSAFHDGNDTYSKEYMDGEDSIEITSHSLPEGLSMGTQEFSSIGGFVNMRRGGYWGDGSLHKGYQGPSATTSQYLNSSVNNVSISPKPFTPKKSRLPVIRSHSPPAEENRSPRPPGSPLKLFGNHDTFTNNKLLRRMSQFEETLEPSIQATDPSSSVLEGLGEAPTSHLSPDAARKNANFRPRPVRSNPVDTSVLESQSDRQANSGISEKSTYADRRQDNMFKSTQELENNKSKDNKQRFIYSLSKYSETKRELNSPTKGSSPKRRRTLQNTEEQDRVWNEPILNSTEFTLDESSYGQGEQDITENFEPADRNGRTFPTSRPTTPTRTKPGQYQTENTVTLSFLRNSNEDISYPQNDDTGDYSTVTNEITYPINSNRKGSITTQDFLNEATKIMNIIRARGRPMSRITSLEEQDGISQEDNSTLYTDESSQERFSRPPSREGADLRKQRTVHEPHPRIVSHLKKFEDKDEFDLVMSASVMSLRLRRDSDLAKDSLPRRDSDPQIDSEQSMESSPNNIRIMSRFQPCDDESGANLSDVPNRESRVLIPSQKSVGSIPTGSSQASSGSSGVKGVISSDMVSHLIPTKVGGMAYDPSHQAWIKAGRFAVRDTHNRSGTVSDDDPFRDIPDLSVNEIQEVATARSHEPIVAVETQNNSQGLESRDIIDGTSEEGQRQDTRPQTGESGPTLPSDSSSLQSKYTRYTSSGPKPGTRATSWATEEADGTLSGQTQSNKAKGLQEEMEDEHKLQTHDCYSPPIPSPTHDQRKQARVVTITFSSPLVSHIAYQDEESLLIGNHGVDGSPSPVSSLPFDANQPEEAEDSCSETSASKAATEQLSSTHEKDYGRPISRIDEEDESAVRGLDESYPQDNSVVPTINEPEQSLVLSRTPHQDNHYSFHLSPLSEFTFNQVDESMRLEVSYITERTNPRSLRQIHGALSLAAEDLVKHLTDAEPYEAYWEQLRRLSLRGKGLITLHQLHKYCSRLEELDIADNQLGQLSGIPSSTRNLNLTNNCLSSLTAWGHLSNLQYLDISHNNLESLDGLSSLVHLRSLKVNNNKLKSIDGVFHLDGLLTLKARNNLLRSVDFKRAELIRLNKLDLSGNQLSSIENIKTLQGLEALDLRDNQVSEFKAWGLVPHLHSLKLSGNYLEQLDISPFPLLRLLYVDCNQLTTIDGLGDCKYLDTLSIREQSFTSHETYRSSNHHDHPLAINLNISALPSLRKLFLSSNIISPDTLSPETPISSLQFLDLASCTLETLPKKFGYIFPHLKSLNLNFNALSDISQLDGILRLNRLSLVGNRISRLRRLCQVLRLVGGGKGSLTRLDLRGNPITVGFYPSPVSGSGRFLTDVDQHLQKQKPRTKQRDNIGTSNNNNSTDENENAIKSLPTIGGGTDIAHRNTPAHTNNTNNYTDYPVLELPGGDKEKTNETEIEIDDPYTVPTADPITDSKYLLHLDESTRLRRRVVELMIHTSTSGRLKHLDGLPLPASTCPDVKGSIDSGNGSGSGAGLTALTTSGKSAGKMRVKKDWVWNRLEELGVLKKRGGAGSST